MIPASDIAQLSNRAFWDVDMSKLDYEKQADYIIRKIFEYGSWNDILEITVYYGIDKIKSVLTTASYLRENTLYFASLFLDIPRSQFKCYTTKQYHPVH
jgi:hypothetical protein